LAAIEEQAAKLRRLRRYSVAKIAWLDGGALSKRPSFAKFVGDAEKKAANAHFCCPPAPRSSSTRRRSPEARD